MAGQQAGNAQQETKLSERFIKSLKTFIKTLNTFVKENIGYIISLILTVTMLYFLQWTVGIEHSELDKLSLNNPVETFSNSSNKNDIAEDIKREEESIAKRCESMADSKDPTSTTLCRLQWRMETLPVKVKLNLHSHIEKCMPWIQFLAVLSLTALCFFTFKTFPLRKKTEWGSAADFAYLAGIISAFYFVYLMIDEYQPAVFVMAMVAIAVAGEHWATLEDFERESGELLTNIKGKTDDLKTGTDQLIKDTENLRNETVNLKKQTSKVLNAMGIPMWKDELYKLWQNAQDKISGIFRIFDVDQEWWDSGDNQKKKLDKADLTDRWNEYFKSPNITLYNALTTHFVNLASHIDHLNKTNEAERDKHKLVDKNLSKLPETKTLIVTDLPMPGTEQWQALEKENMFEVIFGLAWCCCCAAR
jgi:hypothetical protein